MCVPRVTRHTSIRYLTLSSAVNGRPLDLCLHRHPVTNGLVCRRVVCVLCTKCTLHSNHTLTRVIFKHKTTSSPERPVSHYIHSHRLAAGMWTTMKNNPFLGGGWWLWIDPSSWTGFVNTCPTVFLINFCSPGVHYETPCVYLYRPTFVHEA
jgi:hypothetical protein